MDYINFPISEVIAESAYRRICSTTAKSATSFGNDSPTGDAIFDNYTEEDIRNKVIIFNQEFKSYRVYAASSIADDSAPEQFGNEVIYGNNPVKIYVDVDCKDEEYIRVQQLSEKAFIIKYIFPLLSAMYEQFYSQYVIDAGDNLSLYIDADGEDFVLMTSTDVARNKYSIHILFAPTRYAFANIGTLRVFMENVVERLVESDLQEVVDMIDVGVYSSTHNLRTCGAAKVEDPTRIKKLLAYAYPNTCDISGDAFKPKVEKLRWLDTLVSYVGRDMTILGVETNGTLGIDRGIKVLRGDAYDNILINFVLGHLKSGGYMDAFAFRDMEIKARAPESIYGLDGILKRPNTKQYASHVSYYLTFTRIAPSMCASCQRVHDKDNTMYVNVYQINDIIIKISCYRDRNKRGTTLRVKFDNVIAACIETGADISTRLTLLTDETENAGECLEGSAPLETLPQNAETPGISVGLSRAPILKPSKIDVSNRLLGLLASGTGADEVQKIATYLNHTEFANLPNKISYSEPNMRDLVPRELFAELPETLCVDAPMRLGKTKKLIDLIDTYYPLILPDGSRSRSRICILTFRQSFAQHMIDKFSGLGFEIYDKIVGPIMIDKHPRIILQIESLHRLVIKSRVYDLKSQFDVLIMDECESIFDQIDSGLSKRFSEAFATFEWLFRYTKSAILMDAFLSNRSYNIIKRIRALHGCVYHQNTYARSAEDKYDITVDRESWLADLVSAITSGKRIVITCNTLEYAKQIEATISKNYNSQNKLRVILYSSETSASVKAQHLSNVNKYWVNYDILIYTPTISAGVSFEMPHFDILFGYFVSNSCTVESAIQMMGRIRNLSECQYKIYCSNGFMNPGYFPTNLAEIERGVEQRYFNLVNDSNIDLNNVEFTYTENGEISINKSNYYYIWLENTSIRNISRKMFLSRLVTLLLKSGAQIQTLCLNKSGTESTTFTESFEAAGAALKVAEVELIADAENLTLTEYVKLKSRHDSQKMSSGYKFVEQEHAIKLAGSRDVSELPAGAGAIVEESQDSPVNADGGIVGDIASAQVTDMRNSMLDILQIDMAAIYDTGGDVDVFSTDITPGDVAAMTKYILRLFYKTPSYDQIDAPFVVAYNIGRVKQIYIQLNQLVPILPSAGGSEDALVEIHGATAAFIASGEFVGNIQKYLGKLKQDELAYITHRPLIDGRSGDTEADGASNSFDYRRCKYTYLSMKHSLLNRLVLYLGWEHVLDSRRRVSKEVITKNISQNYNKLFNSAGDVKAYFARDKWLPAPIVGSAACPVKPYQVLAHINQLLGEFYDLKIVKYVDRGLEIYIIATAEDLFVFDSIEHRYRPKYTVK